MRTHAWVWTWAALHLVGSASLVNSFATELTRSHCEDRKFAVGEMIMGNAVTPSTEKKLFAVESVTGERITNASFYSNPVPNGDLRINVWLEPKVFQFAFQANCWGCYFVDGKCPRRNRSNKANATLVIPEGFEGPVEVLALWGKTYGEVFLAEPLRFQPAAPEEHVHHTEL